MAPKRKPHSNTSLATAASSDEDTISGFQVVQRPIPTKNSLAAVPADQESDGDEIKPSDGIRENGVPIKRQPQPKRKAVAKIPTKDVASPRKKKAARRIVARPPSPEKAAAAAAPEAAKSPPRKKAAAVASTTDAANSPRPKKAAARTEAAKSPPPKKAAVVATTEAANSPRPKKVAARTDVAGTPPPTGPGDKTANVAASLEAAASAGAEDLAQDGEYDAEKHFKEKSQTYRYLWLMVLTLEQEHSLFLKGAFLKINDAKASTLNTKLKKLSVQAIKQQLKWNDTDKEVMRVLLNLIK
jgi:hypothetical protein